MLAFFKNDFHFNSSACEITFEDAKLMIHKNLYCKDHFLNFKIASSYRVYNIVYN